MHAMAQVNAGSATAGTAGTADNMAVTGADLVRQAAEFQILDPVVNDNEVVLRYAVLDAADRPLAVFGERVTVPVTLDQRDPRVIELVRLLAVCAGTSYFKTAAPPKLRVALGSISAETAELIPALYDHGLREFAVTNALPIPLPVTFEFDIEAEAENSTDGDDGRSSTARARTLGRTGPSDGLRPLVPVGGGKDSALVMSVFPEATPFAIGPPVPSVRVAEVVGRPLLVAQRQIDPLLRTLNETGALNGHIPVTAITSAVSALTAYVTDHTDVLMGNERSASEPTRWVGSEAVNHQFSKSYEFERLFAAAVDRASGGAVRYFSVLRPFSELAIASGLTDDPVMSRQFLSCNRAFTIWRETEQSRTATWCRDCPKCRFTGLMLAPFSTPEELTATMGGNIFADSNQTAGFAELWDADSKPFECVGEMVESAAAMAALALDPEWSQLPVVAALGDSAAAFAETHEASLATELVPGTEHQIPDPYWARIAARLDPNR
jgi:AcrR family transcriptional regulator